MLQAPNDRIIVGLSLWSLEDLPNPIIIANKEKEKLAISLAPVETRC